MNTHVQRSEQNAGEVERVLAIGGGAMLVLAALKRAPLALVLAGLGWALIYRGVVSRRPLGDAVEAAGAVLPQAGRASHTLTEEQIDETVEETFPASDPPGWRGGSSFTQVSE